VRNPVTKRDEPAGDALPRRGVHVAPLRISCTVYGTEGNDEHQEQHNDSF
jgi:hypothetical protein